VWTLNRVLRKTLWTCERFVSSRLAQWAVYYKALVPVRTYLSIWLGRWPQHSKDNSVGNTQLTTFYLVQLVFCFIHFPIHLLDLSALGHTKDYKCDDPLSNTLITRSQYVLQKCGWTRTSNNRVILFEKGISLVAFSVALQALREI